MTAIQGERIRTDEPPTETLNRAWMLVPLWKLEGPNAYNEDDCAARFAEKYGHPPEYVFEWQRNLWLGPIETNQMIER